MPSKYRAGINCLRCYNVAQSINSIIQVINSPDVLKNAFNNSDSLYFARNEALKAVEDLVMEQGEKETILSKCAGCNFSKSKILDYLQKRK